MIRALLFDSDGVLVDTEPLFFDATRIAFASAGANLSREQWARWYLAEAKHSGEIADQLGLGESRRQTALAERDRLFWTRMDEGVPIFPGVVETLQTLARRFRLAVVTGAPRKRFERIHASTNLCPFFETIVACDEHEYAKPHPWGYRTVLERLGLKPEECLAVEDSPRGAVAAVSAGIACCVIPTPLTLRTLCPPECAILNDFTQLIPFLDEENRNP
ncbi:MAG: HAD family phosphatase [Phycisphaerae bacterium]|nr:HAD family phosphatase [Phycisphaerae bacterium]